MLQIEHPGGVGEGVYVGVGVWVIVGVGVLVAVGDGVVVPVSVIDGVAVGVTDRTDVGDGVGVLVFVGLGIGVSVTFGTQLLIVDTGVPVPQVFTGVTVHLYAFPGTGVNLTDFSFVVVEMIFDPLL